MSETFAWSQPLVRAQYEDEYLLDSLDKQARIELAKFGTIVGEVTRNASPLVWGPPMVEGAERSLYGQGSPLAPEGAEVVAYLVVWEAETEQAGVDA